MVLFSSGKKYEKEDLHIVHNMNNYSTEREKKIEIVQKRTISIFPNRSQELRLSKVLTSLKKRLLGIHSYVSLNS